MTDHLIALFFWMAHLLVGANPAPELPDGQLQMFVDRGEAYGLVPQADGFVVSVPEGGTNPRVITVRVQPSGLVSFESDGEQEVVDLSARFGAETLPASTRDYLFAECGFPIASEDCGITLDEDLGRLSLWSWGGRYDLVWREPGLDLGPACFDVLSALRPQGFGSDRFEPLLGQGRSGGGFAQSIEGGLRGQDLLTDDIRVRGWTITLEAGETLIYSALTQDGGVDAILVGPDGCPLEDAVRRPVVALERGYVAEVRAEESGTHRLLVTGEVPGSAELPVSVEVASSRELHNFGERLDEDLWDEAFFDDDWGGDNWRELPAGLEAEGRILMLDTSVSGFLQGGASRFLTPGGHPLEAWALQLEPGQTVTIDLRSEEVDAYLYLAGGAMETPIEDDDGGLGLNSQIVYTSLAGGGYLVVASSYGDQPGAYTLEARDGDWGSAAEDPWDSDVWDEALWDDGDDWSEFSDEEARALPSDLDASGRVIQAPGVAEGYLDFSATGLAQAATPGGQLLEAWDLLLLPGQEIQIDLISEDFDAYLYLVPDPASGLAALEDDDGGEATDSQIRYRSQAGGRYRVVVSSYWPSETGAYRLEVVRLEP
jgi:hypothetical protein